MRRVCVVIVTYNRKELLVNLLHDLAKQSYAVSAILIVDNDSSDGTPDLLMENKIISFVKVDEITTQEWKNLSVHYFRNSENAGGSGGFAKAFELVLTMDYDCVWAMDDDVSPEINCLEEMMKYLDKDARVCIPSRGDENYVDYAITGYDLKTLRYFHFEDCKRNRIDSRNISEPYVEVKDMVFEGPLFTMDLIKEIGVPDKGYFILFDDTDYAHRAYQKTSIRYVAHAILHKKVFPPKVEGAPWGWKSYYKLRNSVYFEKKYGENLRVRYLRSIIRLGDLFIRAVLRRRFKRAKWIVRAYLDGVTGRMGKVYAPEEIISD